MNEKSNALVSYLFADIVVLLLVLRIGVHRGVFGRFRDNVETDLAPDSYDWRNPTLLVEVTQMRGPVKGKP